MFKKGDYIVTLRHTIGTDCAKPNFIFKQREKSDYINPCCDITGNKINGNSRLTFDKRDCLKEWRYATSHEIKEYDRLNKPFDVTELKPETYEIF